MRPIFDNFAGTEYYVDALGGSDVTGTGTLVNPWQTIKYAIETGITRNATNGDRVNLLNNSNHSVSGSKVDISLYATDGTDSAPLVIQGCSAVANDGGMARVNVASSIEFISDTTFDYLRVGDLDVSGDFNGFLVRIDRLCHVECCRIINNHATNGLAIEIDSGTRITRSYLEGANDGIGFADGVVNGVAACFADLCFVKQNGDGNATTDIYFTNSIIWVAGNPTSGATAVRENSGGGVNNVVVCTGTPHANSRGIYANSPNPTIGNYVENFGVGIKANDPGVIIVGNAYSNCTTPIEIDNAAYVETPIDAGSSILANAATGDFAIVAGTNPVDELNVKGGWTNGTEDMTFDLFIDAGTGFQKTGGNSLRFNPFQSLTFAA